MEDINWFVVACAVALAAQALLRFFEKKIDRKYGPDVTIFLAVLIFLGYIIAAFLYVTS